MAMGMMAGQSARQGYSKINDGYNEQPGINWGRVGAYAGGAALGYGVLRAGAMKAGKSGAWKDVVDMSGLRGMKKGGGWKAYEQHGVAAINQKRADMIGKQISEARAGEKAWHKHGRYMDSPAGRAHRQGVANGQAMLAEANANFSKGATPGRRQAARAAGKAAGTSKPIAKGLAAKLDKGGKGPRIPWVDSLPAGPSNSGFTAPNGPKPIMINGKNAYAAENPFKSQIKALRDERRGLANAFEGKGPKKEAIRAGAGALGFFGAMDLRGESLKRAGAIGMRGFGALGAIGLGMKALSWANPFNNN